jgi:hypothetical protein
MTNFRELLSALTRGRVEYIVVGGAAATALGSARLTLDLDIVYCRSAPNLGRLAAALAPLSPYLRGAPPGLPFHLDAATLRRGLNFTMTTSAGSLDLLGEIAGGGSYESLIPFAAEMNLYGCTCLCLTLRKLIEVKRAAGRPKDFEAIAELEAILEETEPGGPTA